MNPLCSAKCATTRDWQLRRGIVEKQREERGPRPAFSFRWDLRNRDGFSRGSDGRTRVHRYGIGRKRLSTDVNFPRGAGDCAHRWLPRGEYSGKNRCCRDRQRHEARQS